MEVKECLPLEKEWFQELVVVKERPPGFPDHQCSRVQPEMEGETLREAEVEYFEGE